MVFCLVVCFGVNSLVLSFSVQFLFREVLLPHCRFKGYNAIKYLNTTCRRVTTQARDRGRKIMPALRGPEPIVDQAHLWSLQGKFPRRIRKPEQTTDRDRENGDGSPASRSHTLLPARVLDFPAAPLHADVR